MALSRRTMFRDKALQYYTQSREKDILPRFVTPPVFLFLWMLLVLLLAAAVLAWLGQVPTYVTGSGVVLSQVSKDGGAVSVIFLPATPSLHVQPGLPVRLQVGATGPVLSTTVATVDDAVISPAQARQRYKLTGDLASVITQPSIVITAMLGASTPAKTYAGSTVSAQAQVGSRRVLSLLPGIGSLIGG